MQREFSKELAEDRQFEIGGELFAFRYPHWQETAALYEEDAEEVKKQEENGDEPTFSLRADTELAIRRIPIFLDPANDAHKRFKTLINRKTDPVPRHQITQLYRWLVQVTAGLPTRPPSELESGGGNSDIPSEEESS